MCVCVCACVRVCVTCEPHPPPAVSLRLPVPGDGLSTDRVIVAWANQDARVAVESRGLEHAVRVAAEVGRRRQKLVCGDPIDEEPLLPVLYDPRASASSRARRKLAVLMKQLRVRLQPLVGCTVDEHPDFKGGSYVDVLLWGGSRRPHSW